MSDYFNVSTDYILKGDTLKKQEENKNNSVSKILYIASTAFIAIGLLCAFASWYNEKTVETIWGSMIIQVVGIKIIPAFPLWDMKIADIILYFVPTMQGII